MDRKVIKRLAALTLTPSGDVEPRIAAYALQELGRGDVKVYLSALKAEVARRRVRVSVSGGEEAPLAAELSRSFGGMQTVVTKDDSLGAGVLLNRGDDRLDASVKGLVRQTIDRLRKT